MTCFEKAKIEIPHMVDDDYYGGVCGCPHEYEFLPRPVYCNDVTKETCSRCWNREIPEEEPTYDTVNHPKHYCDGGMECIDEMILVFGVEATMNFCLLNAWKYRRRALYKNGEEDLNKSHTYLRFYRNLKEFGNAKSES